MASTSASSTSGPSSGTPRRSLIFSKFAMTSFWRRSTWTPLLLRRSTPALRLRLLSRSLLRRLDRPTATTSAAMATMAVATAARTAAAVVVVTLATPPQPPLDPLATTIGPLLHGQCTSTHGRGTSPCTLARYLRDGARKPSCLRQVTTRPRDSCPSSSSSHCTSRPHLFLLQARHPRMAQAGTSSRSQTPSPWRPNHLLPRSRTG
jgi:hypothetical protein